MTAIGLVIEKNPHDMNAQIPAEGVFMIVFIIVIKETTSKYF